MIRKHTTLLLLFGAWLVLGAAPPPAERTITGTIASAEESTPLEGVQVTVKGTNRVSGSQADGIYYIPVAEKDSVLVFSHGDFQTQEVKLTESNEYNVLLHRKKGPWQ